MRDYLVGTTGSYPIHLRHGHEPVIPDSGTVKYTVRDHNGVPIPGLVDVSYVTGPTTHVLNILLPSFANTLAAGKKFERRTITVVYEKATVPYSVSVNYRVVPFLNHAVTPQSVRNFLGVNATELPDDDIDLSRAYFRASEIIGATQLVTALSSGNMDEVDANLAIEMLAVIDIIPSLRQRVAQQEQNGVKMFSRPAIKDFDALQAEAERRLQSALGGLAINLEAEPFTLLVTTQDPDPILGV